MNVLAKRSKQVLQFVMMMLVLAGSAFVSAAATAEDITHSFLAVGHSIPVVIVSEKGEIEWQFDAPASDCWLLPNNHILLALYPTDKYPHGAVIEMVRDTKEIVFEFQGRQQEISTAVRLLDGNTLIAELGPKPQALLVNQDGNIESSMPLACQTENLHMQTRMLRVLPNGHYLAPHLFDFAVKEYDPKTGEVLKSLPTDDRGRDKHDWPFTAIRLADGNTLIGCTHGNRVIEVDPEGKIVWSLTNEDLGEELIHDACGVQRLPNGNTVITSYANSGDAVKLFEVTRDKKVVWRFSGLKAGIHNFQILTTNAKPLDDTTIR